MNQWDFIDEIVRNGLFFHFSENISDNQWFFTTLAKVSDWNSFRVNQNYFDSFRYLYPSQCESFQTNPKNVLYLVWWKTVKNQSDLIRLNSETSIWMNPNQSETRFSIQINPNESKVGIIRINSDWKIGLDQSDLGLIRIHSDWCLRINRIMLDCFLTVFHQTRYKTFFGLVRNDSHWLGMNFNPILSPG